MLIRPIIALGALLCAITCTPSARDEAPATDEGTLARSVTIVRDEWGVPHIYGPTDASVAFGAAFAQAEDNYWQIEEDYIHALGRASHFYGERYLAADVLVAALEVERLAREEYAREPPQQRALWDAFATGLNYYLRVSGLQPRLITRWAPWMLFARVRSVDANGTIDGVQLGTLATAAGLQLTGAIATAPHAETTDGSRAWAVSPARSAAGRALLVQAVSMPFFGRDQLYEMHLHSSAGWHVRGFALLGTPVPRAGNNEHIGWSHTRSDTDSADVYAVTFDHATDPLAYRVDGEWRHAVEWVDTLQVNTAQGVVPRAFRFRRTEHGPIIAMHNGRFLALRIARMTEGGALQQTYAMSRAAGLAEFRAALAHRAITASTTYADAEGNILHVNGNAVPVRDSAFDWSAPVDGNTARTSWRGYHELNVLQQQLNPPSGTLYSAPPGSAAHVAAGGDSTVTLAQLAELSFDVRIDGVAEQVAPLVLDWEEVGGSNPQRAMLLDEALALLRAWDGNAAHDSTATTLYVLWQERLRRGDYTGRFARLRALEDVVARLRSDWRSVAVPWSELNRLQRVHTSGAQPFREDTPSFPLRGLPGWTGAAFTIETVSVPDGLRRYAVRGNVIQAVELGAPPRALSISAFGQSADPASPVHTDQAPMYMRGELKPAWFARDDVIANARRTYRPSESVTVPARAR